MKNYIFMLITLLTITGSISQDRHTEVKVYIPLRTYHFDRTPDYEYHSTEGGNIGAVAIYRRSNGKWFNDIQVGAIRNSYDNLAILGQLGIGRHIGKINVSLNLGLISGYKNLFEDKVTVTEINYNYKGKAMTWTSTHIEENENSYRHIMPSWMKDNGILPAASLSISYDTGFIAPLIVISPEYINAGIRINIL